MSKVLLVYPNLYEPWMPMGITHISRYLKDAGHEVFLFDTTKYNIGTTSREELLIKERVFRTHEPWYTKENILLPNLLDIYRYYVDSINPDIIGISIMAHDMLDLSNRIIDVFGDSIPTIAGGIVPTITPNMVSDSAWKVVGEGELTMTEIANDPNILSESDRIVYGKHIDMNDLKYPDWELMSDMYMHWPFGSEVYRFGRFDRTRGCHNGYCKYCIYSNKLYPKELSKVRAKTNGRIIEELIEYRDRYKLQYITFNDDNFLGGNEDNNLEFLDMYWNRIRLPFIITTHPNTITPRLAKEMKNAGSVHVSMAIESGSEYMRSEVLGRKVDDSVMIESFRLLKEQGIHTASLNMIGLPFETRKMFSETVDLNRKCMPDKGAVYFFYPYPGSVLRDVSFDAGFINGDEPYVSFAGDTIMNLPKFSKKDIHDYKKTFNIRYRFPKYISSIVGWLGARNSILFNVFSKYRMDKI